MVLANAAMEAHNCILPSHLSINAAIPAQPLQLWLSNVIIASGISINLALIEGSNITISNSVISSGGGFPVLLFTLGIRGALIDVRTVGCRLLQMSTTTRSCSAFWDSCKTRVCL